MYFPLHYSNTHLFPFLIPIILRQSSFQIFASQGIISLFHTLFDLLKSINDIINEKLCFIPV